MSGQSIQKTEELRDRLEFDFVSAALTAIIQGTVEFDDLHAICPYQLLKEASLSRTIYYTMYKLAEKKEKILLDTIAIYIQEAKSRHDDKEISLPVHFQMAQLGSYAISLYGNSEDAVFFYANKVREEGLKRKTEYELYKLISDCQVFGTPLDGVAGSINHIKSMVESDVLTDTSMASLVDSYIKELNSGNFSMPLPSPWDNLNHALKGGIVSGELAVLAARPGMGKTALACCYAIEAARNGYSVAFFSREVPAFTLMNRFISREKRIDISVFREFACMTPNIKKAIIDGATKFKDMPLDVIENTIAPMTPSEIRRTVKRMKKCDLVVIDYLQLLTPDTPQRNREREVADMSRAMKQLALDCHCPVLLLSQLNRSVEQSTREPNLSDLRESGAIEQDADIVIFLHTTSEYKTLDKMPVKAIVAKGRSSGTGIAGLMFDKKFSDFVEDNDKERWSNKNRQGANRIKWDL